jgi:hypothetical protein
MRETNWMRPLLRVGRAFDRKQVSDRTVADHLAELNLRVHQLDGGRTVGSRCVIAWRRPQGAGGVCTVTTEKPTTMRGVFR